MDVTERIAAIYGPNAAGKSTVLDAMLTLSLAIRSPGSAIIRQPSLCGNDGDALVQFDVEFIAARVRYRYEVAAAPWGIERETLSSYPKGSERVLFTRTSPVDKPGVEVKAESSPTGPTLEVRRVTKPNITGSSRTRV